MKDRDNTAWQLTKYKKQPFWSPTILLCKNCNRCFSRARLPNKFRFQQSEARNHDVGCIADEMITGDRAAECEQPLVRMMAADPEHERPIVFAISIHESEPQKCL